MDPNIEMYKMMGRMEASIEAFKANFIDQQKDIKMLSASIDKVTSDHDKRITSLETTRIMGQGMIKVVAWIAGIIAPVAGFIAGLFGGTIHQ